MESLHEAPVRGPAESRRRSAEIRDALRDIAPAALAAIPFGLLYGALCVAKGMAPIEVMLMSALVCAGAAQFAAVEVWGYPVPVAALAFSTLLVNARFVIMGASLAPKTGLLARWQRLVGFYVLSDENWALGERRSGTHPLTAAYFLTMGAVLYVNWVSWTTLGAVVGPLLGEPRRIGADFAFTALFIGLVAGFWTGRGTAATVAASLAVSALVYVTLGSPWHIMAGAAAGIAAAYAAAPRDAPARPA